jgi:hypothetical protein
VVILKRFAFRGVEVAAISQPDGSIVWIPAMTDPSAAHCKLCKEPRFSIDILGSLRAEIDALLGFLKSDSETEKEKDEATIQHLQGSLFEEDEPPVVLAAAQMAELATLLEIAAALATGELGDDQDHV